MTYDDYEEDEIGESVERMLEDVEEEVTGE